jgi:hypothetical protein
VGRRAVVAGYRVVFAVLTLVAIVAQAASLANQGAFNPGNFFSFFTIQSNLIAVGLLVAGVVMWRADRSPALDFLRGAAVVYMTVTGIVYFLLLRNTDVDTALSWVNSVVHELMPLVIVADWLIDPPRTRITVWSGLLWLSYPLVWIVYTLIRGAITNWYPYPFVNPANGGYASVALTSAVIAVFTAALCVGVVAVGNALGARRSPGEVPAV